MCDTGHINAYKHWAVFEYKDLPSKSSHIDWRELESAKQRTLTTEVIEELCGIRIKPVVWKWISDIRTTTPRRQWHLSLRQTPNLYDRASNFDQLGVGPWASTGVGRHHDPYLAVIDRIFLFHFNHPEVYFPHRQFSNKDFAFRRI